MSSVDSWRYTGSKLPECGEINLALGYPATSSLRVETIRKAFDQMFEEKISEPEFFHYSYATGYREIRRLLAEFLMRLYNLRSCEIEAGDLAICGGVAYGLDSILSVLGVDSSSVVFCEELTYYATLKMFRERNCQLVFVPFTKHGHLDLDWLETQLTQNQLWADNIKLVYTIPTFQNPSGAIMPEHMRVRLIELAHRFNFYIASDEIYNLTPFSPVKNSLPTSMALLDNKEDGRVFSLGSFSKVLSPSLRFGWIHTSRNLVAKLVDSGVMFCGSCVCHLSCGAMEVIFRNRTIDTIIEAGSKSLEHRANSLFEALVEHLPKSCSLNCCDRDGPVSRPLGGCFIVIQLPQNVSASKLALVCEEKHKLTIQPTSSFGDRRDDRVRLCFSYHSPSELKNGAILLANAVKELEDSSSLNNF